MQYHYDGFEPGDPSVRTKSGAEDRDRSRVDVLIIGCGPAGLTLAAQLAQFSDISTRIVERKSGPLEMGQADGIACRSMEMFEAFGFADRVKKEAYWVNETCFWRPASDGGIARADRIKDVEDDLSEMPHTILSQARVHDFFLEEMAKAPSRLFPDYDLELDGLHIEQGATHPVVAQLRGLNGTRDEVVRAKYVVGCDGARSAVRKAMGLRLEGQAARQLWGVMDVLAVTDFPDIRLKCAIQSADAGSILVIPREGGTMVRLYIELDALKDDERAADRNVTSDMLIQRARAILSPYQFDVKEVVWCSAYEIGQRVSARFDNLGGALHSGDDPHVFIAGDACHTHSPKAGQGMNVSMADTFNLGWKLAAVLRGQAAPRLLKSYSEERQAKAQELIDFDRDMAKLFSSKDRKSSEEARFQAYFQKHGRYTAGVETRYEPSGVIAAGCDQSLADGLRVGARFHSAPVIRLADAKPMQLGHVLRADGRWRVILFADEGDTGAAGGAVANVCGALTSGTVAEVTRRGDDRDAVIDLRAVFQQGHRHLDLGVMPAALRPAKGRLGLTDYEKIFCADLSGVGDLFDMRGIDRQRGAMVLIRPDQFVAGVYALTDHAELSAFLDQVLLPGPSLP
ncbi:FAD-dependent monooxygenase [Sulfitobacter mediterraneus]|uniref:FAD-dependent monooxygenase n=1 Tax=Sulfitobacter mediterraneus TaxID=83219 RepID=UPI001933BEF8|nr:FAD-dependent monooxygenase [Sulfitobacter mediterraneus]MBM1309932.1 FAD-dependent monooxygenase [Sulfitobacter mediterraneus]MBM1313816.1 FAD-dependent monooxygenase [Sulfitobacter mediterraneus]MBM1324631.1 FAD-dependent monooxygenase [Sulfitobacter mediterraneus]MBM1326088.1 FAD-dependent monooxygenase [Sulfitobacter mediterraneus]MBM1397434.1 FAD-dependent monooxygenase [Sulfitobacter mediterraneus]